MKSFVSLTDIAKSKLARGHITQEEYDEIIAADTRLQHAQHAQHAQHGAVADPGVGARDAHARIDKTMSFNIPDIPAPDRHDGLNPLMLAWSGCPRRVCGIDITMY